MPSFRPATQADSSLLYEWRQQAEAAPWYEAEPTSREDHDRWFNARVDDPLVHLLIWEDDEGPLGTVRIDSNGEVAFWSPDLDQNAEMLSAATFYADQYGGRLKITLDQDDVASMVALNRAGFRTYPARTLVYTP